MLVLPLFAWLFHKNPQEIPSSATRHGHNMLVASMLAVLGVYWWLRHSMIPTGSEADLHGFDMDVFTASYASFIAGFPIQSNSFAYGSPMFWIGIVAVIMLMTLTRGFPAKLVVLAILGLCGPLYWGMFGYQDGNIMNHLNFVGRLYLIPFALILFISFTEPPRRLVILLITLFSVYGMVLTYRQHFIFQQTFAEIYHLAQSSDERLVVDFPQASSPGLYSLQIEDSLRDLVIGDFPDAVIQINPREGGLVTRD